MNPYYKDDSVELWNSGCLGVSWPKAELILTDPPYDIEDMSAYFMAMVASMGKDASLYCFGDKRMVAGEWYRQLPEWHRAEMGGKPRPIEKDLLAWHYRNSPKPKGRWRMSMQLVIYAWDGEPCFDEDAARVPYSPAAERNRGKPRASSGRYPRKSPYADATGALPRDVIECPALVAHLAAERVGHPDQKPLELVRKLVRVSSRPGDLVLDPFAGSGTTLVAARMEGRRAWGCEIDEGNCEMIARRLAANGKEGVWGPAVDGRWAGSK